MPFSYYSVKAKCFHWGPAQKSALPSAEILQCHQEFPLTRHSMKISSQPSQYWCELSPLQHPRIPECSGPSHTQLAGAALPPYNSNEAICFSQCSTTDFVAIDWVASGHRRENQRIWMAQAVFEHGGKEKAEKSVLSVAVCIPVCIPCSYWSALTHAHLGLCGIRYQRNTWGASKIHHSRTPKLQNEWSSRLDITEQLQHNKKKNDVEAKSSLSGCS